MTAIGRGAAATLALLMVLAACDRPGPAPAATAPKPAAPAAPKPPPPLGFRETTDTAEIELKLPPEAASIEALYTRLFAEGRNDLSAFAEGAKGEVEDLRASGDPVRAYARSLEYRLTAQTPRLISLSRTDYENTGGAHPNSGLTALVWDKQAARAVAPGDLFAAGADMAGADAALCDAIKAARRARVGEATLAGSLTACPRLADSQIALARSTAPGKAGGLLILFPTYALGPRPEGEYRIVLPLSAVEGVLAQPYRAEFAGAPAPDAAGPTP